MPLSTAVGLDRIAGEGGCVRCQIRAWDEARNQPGRALWDSVVFRGSDGLQSSGTVDVTSLPRIVLCTDDAHTNRPVGADPLDIRDDVCWLTPLVEFDLAHLKQPGFLAQALPGLDAWEQQGDAWSQSSLGHRWNESTDRWEAVLTVPPQTRLQLRTKAAISSASDVLELVTAISPNFAEQQFELRVDGERLEWQASEDRETMAIRHQKHLSKWLQKTNRFSNNYDDSISDSLAYWWDLQAYRGREVTLEFTIVGGGNSYQLPWQDFSLRSAIANLPADGELPRLDIPLTEAAIVGSNIYKGRGSPIKNMLPYSGKDMRPIEFLGQIHGGGYGMVRRSEFTFELKPDYRKFVAVVGGCRLITGPLQVAVDGKVIWEKAKVNALSPAELIELPLPDGARQMTLSVGAEGASDSAAAWANVGFMTK